MLGPRTARLKYKFLHIISSGKSKMDAWRADHLAAKRTSVDDSPRAEHTLEESTQISTNYQHRGCRCLITDTWHRKKKKNYILYINTS